MYCSLIYLLQCLGKIIMEYFYLSKFFSFTFQSVQIQTDLVWRYERYSLIREYFGSPPLFPPLFLIMHVIELITSIFRHLLRYEKTTRKKIFSNVFSRN